MKDNGNEDLIETEDALATKKLIEGISYLSNVTKLEVRFNSQQVNSVKSSDTRG